MNVGGRVKEKMVCRPEGLLGRLGGRMMALDRDLPAWVLDLLEVGSSESIIKVGSGPGVAVELAAERANAGWVVGVDPSETMLDMARRRSIESIAEGRVEFHFGTADDLPFDDSSFDAALTINSLHLWPDPVAGLEEVGRVLGPSGRIAVAFSRFSPGSADEFERPLVEAGFRDVSEQTGDRGTCLLAEW